MSAKRRILEAALSVFSHHGFRQASVELVADEVGVTRQALYRHYPSKEAMFQAVVEDLHAASLDATREAIGRAKLQGAGMAAIVFAAIDTRSTLMFERLTTSPYAAEILEENSRHCGAITAKYSRQFENLLAEAIEFEIQRTGARLADKLTPADLARLLCAGSKGLKSSDPVPDLNAFRPDLKRLVQLIVNGATGETGRESATGGHMQSSPKVRHG